MSQEPLQPKAAARKEVKAGHWIVSGIAAVLILHLIGFLLNRAARLADTIAVDLGLHIQIAILSVQLTAIVAWVFLPVALFLWRRAVLKGSEGIGTPALIGFALAALSWLIVAPITQMLIPAMIAASIVTGCLIGVSAWLIITGWVPYGFRQATS